MKTTKTPANSAPTTFRYNNPKDIDWRIEKGNHRYNEIRDLVFQGATSQTRKEEPFFTPFSVSEFKGATFYQLHEAMNAEIQVKVSYFSTSTKDFKVSPNEILWTIRQAEADAEDKQTKNTAKPQFSTGSSATPNDTFKDKLLLKSLASGSKNLSVKANNQEVIMSMMDALKSILENKSLSGGTQISSKDKLQNIRTTLTNSRGNPLYPIINSIYEKHSSIKATSAYKLYCFEQELLLLQRQIDQYVPQYEKYLLRLTGPKVKISITTPKTPSNDIADSKELIKIFQEGIDRKLETVNKVEKKQINRLFGERTRLFEAEKSPSLEDLESTVFTKEQLEELLSKDLAVETNDSLEGCLKPILSEDEIEQLREILCNNTEQKKSLRSNIAKKRVFDFLDNLKGDAARKTTIKNFKENNDELSFLLDNKIVSSDQKKLWIQIEEALEDIIQFDRKSPQAKISHAKIRGFLDTGDGKTFLAEEIISGIEAIIKRVGNAVSDFDRKALVDLSSKDGDAKNKFAKQSILAKNFRIVKINLANQEAIEALLQEAKEKSEKLPLLGVFVIGDEFPFFKTDPRLRELTAAGAKVTGFSASANIVELMDAVHQAKEKNPEQKQIDKNKKELQLLRSGTDLDDKGTKFGSVRGSADSRSLRGVIILAGSLENAGISNPQDQKVERIAELEKENANLEQAGKYRKVKVDAAEGNYNAAIVRRTWAREVANKLSDSKSFVPFNLNDDADNSQGSLQALVTSAHKKSVNTCDQYRRTQCIFPGLVFEAATIEARLKNIATTNAGAVITANYMKGGKHYSAIYEGESIKHYAADSDLFKERIEAIAKSTAGQNVIMIYAGEYAGVVGGDNGALSNLDPDHDNQVVFLQNEQHVDIDLLKQMFSRDRGKEGTLPRRVVIDSSLQQLFSCDKKLGDVAFDKNQKEDLVKRAEHFKKKIRKYFSGKEDDEIDNFINNNFIIDGAVYKQQILDCEIGIKLEDKQNKINIQKINTDYKGDITFSPEWNSGDQATLKSEVLGTQIKDDPIQYIQNKFTRDLRLLILYKSMADGTFNISDYAKIIDSENYLIPSYVVSQLSKIKKSSSKILTPEECAKNFEELSYLARAEKDINVKKEDFRKKYQEKLISAKQLTLDLAKTKREESKVSAQLTHIQILANQIKQNSNKVNEERLQIEEAIKDAQQIITEDKNNESSNKDELVKEQAFVDALKKKLENLQKEYNELEEDYSSKTKELGELKIKSTEVNKELEEVIKIKTKKDSEAKKKAMLKDEIRLLSGEIASVIIKKEKMDKEITSNKKEIAVVEKNIKETLIWKKEKTESLKAINHQKNRLELEKKLLSKQKDEISGLLEDAKEKKSSLEKNLFSLETRMNSYQKTAEELINQIKQITKEKQELELNNDDLRTDLNLLEKNIKKEEVDNYTLEEKKIIAEGLITANEKKIALLKKELETFTADLEEAEKNNEALKEELKNKNNLLEEAKKNNEDLNEKLQTLETSIKNLDFKLKEIEAAKVNVEGLITANEKKIALLKKELETFTADLEEAEKNNEALKEELKNKNNLLEEAKKNNEDLNEKLQTLETSIKNLDFKLKEIEAAKVKLKEIEAAKKEEYGELEELETSLETELQKLSDSKFLKSKTADNLQEERRKLKELLELEQEKLDLKDLEGNEHIKSSIAVLKNLQDKIVGFLEEIQKEVTPKNNEISHGKKKIQSEDNHFIPEETGQENLDAFNQKKEVRDDIGKENLKNFRKVKPLSLSASHLKEAFIVSEIQPKNLSLFAEPQKIGKRDDRYYNAEFNGIKFLETEEGRKLAGGQGIFNDAILFLAKFKKCEFTGVDFSKMDPEILGTIKFTSCTFHNDCKFPKGFRFKASNISNTIFRGKAEDTEAARKLGLYPAKEIAAHQVISLGSLVEIEFKGEEQEPKSFASAAMEQLRSNKIHPLDSEKPKSVGRT